MTLGQDPGLVRRWPWAVLARKAQPIHAPLAKSSNPYYSHWNITRSDEPPYDRADRSRNRLPHLSFHLVVENWPDVGKINSPFRFQWSLDIQTPQVPRRYFFLWVTYFPKTCCVLSTGDESEKGVLLSGYCTFSSFQSFYPGRSIVCFYLNLTCLCKFILSALSTFC